MKFYYLLLLMVGLVHNGFSVIKTDQWFRYSSWGEGEHNGYYDDGGENAAGTYLSRLTEDGVTYELKAAADRGRGVDLFRVVGGDETFIMHYKLPGFLVDVYEQGDVCSVVLNVTLGYRILVYHFQDGVYQQRMFADVRNNILSMEGKDESIKAIRLVSPYELEIVRVEGEQEIYSLATRSIAGLSPEAVEEAKFLVGGELPDEKALSSFEHRQKKELSPVDSHAVDAEANVVYWPFIVFGVSLLLAFYFVFRR